MKENYQEKMHPVEKTWSIWIHLPSFLRVRLKRVWSSLGFSTESATLMRFEVDMLILRMRQFSSISYRKKMKNYRKRQNILLHLGCGNTVLSDWVNIDCYPPPASQHDEIIMHDMRYNFKFSSQSVSEISSAISTFVVIIFSGVLLATSSMSIPP